MKTNIQSKEELINELELAQKRIKELEKMTKNKTEDSLIQTNENLRATLNSIGDAVITTDLNNLITYMNPVAEKLCNWKFKDAKGKKINKILNIINANTRKKIDNPVKKVIQSGKIITLANHPILISKNGDEYNIADSVSPIKNTKGDITGIVVLFRNVSGEYIMQEELKKNEDKFHTVADFSYDWEYWIDAQGEYAYISPSCERISGYSQNEFIKNPKFLISITYPDDINIIQNHKHRIYKNGKIEPIEFRIITKSGKIRWISHVCQSVFDNNGTYIGRRGSNRDITSRKMIEQKFRKITKQNLIQSENKFNSLFNNNPNPAHIVNTDFEIVLTNAILLKLKNLKQEDIIGKKCYAVYQNKKEICENCAVKEVFKNKTNYQYENKLLLPDGSIKYFETYAYPIFDEQKNVNYAVETTIDITDRKNIEIALRDSEEKYRSFVENSPNGIVVTNNNYIIIYANPELSNILLYNHDEIIGKDFRNFFDDDFQSIVADIYIRRQKGENIPKRYSFNVITKTGEKRIVEIVNTVIKNAKGEQLTLAQIDDITERKKAEEELLKLAKLESLGLLAGGIAHNFKNILANISFNISLAKYKPNKITEYLDKIDKAVAQASALATRFQTFSIGGEPIIETISVKDVLNDVLNIAMSGSEIMSNIKSDDNLSNVEADAKQLNEVFMNLIINSKQAMPKGGRIDISLQNITLNNGNDLNINGGKYVEISIRDNGMGIAKEKLSKIFDPFYTNKVNGSGLGLASVQFIIKKHKGAITVDSELDKWTEFNIYLPASELELEVKTNLDSEEKIHEGIGNKILYVDDNENLRENIALMGEIINYKIDTAKDGNEAIALFEKAIINKEPYEAVILDLTFQGSDMQGEDILHSMQKIDKNIKAIVFSGHSTKPIVANYKDYGFTARLDKPINTEKLTKVLKKVCNS